MRKGHLRKETVFVTQNQYSRPNYIKVKSAKPRKNDETRNILTECEKMAAHEYKNNNNKLRKLLR